MSILQPHGEPTPSSQLLFVPNSDFPDHDPDHDDCWSEWNCCEESACGSIVDELWEVFELNDETIEPEPEPGDFWGELDEHQPI